MRGVGFDYGGESGRTVDEDFWEIPFTAAGVVLTCCHW